MTAVVPEPGDGWWPGAEMAPWETYQFIPSDAWVNGLYARDDGNTYTAGVGTAFVVPTGEPTYYTSITPRPVVTKAQWRVRVRGTGTFTLGEYLDVGTTYDWYDDPGALTYSPVGTFPVASASWVTLTADAMAAALTQTSLESDCFLARFDVTVGELEFDWACLRAETADGYFVKTGAGTWSSWNPAFEQTITTGFEYAYTGLAMLGEGNSVTVDPATFPPPVGEAQGHALTVFGRIAGLPFGAAASGTDVYYGSWRTSTQYTYAASGAGVAGYDEDWIGGAPPIYIPPKYTVTATATVIGMRYVAPAPKRDLSVPIPGVAGLHWVGTYDYEAGVLLQAWMPYKPALTDVAGLATFEAYSAGADNTADDMTDYDTSYMLTSVDARIIPGWTIGDAHPDVLSDGTAYAAATVVPPDSPTVTQVDVSVSALPAHSTFALVVGCEFGGVRFRVKFRPKVLFPKWRYLKPEWDLAPEEDAGGAFQILLPTEGWRLIGTGQAGFTAGALKLSIPTGWVKEQTPADGAATTRPLYLQTAVGVWTKVADMVGP